MEKEKEDKGARDIFKILLEESLKQQRKTMMGNFAQILQRLPKVGASTSGSYSGSTTPFMV